MIENSVEGEQSPSESTLQRITEAGKLLERIWRTDRCWFWNLAYAKNNRAYYKNQLVYRLLYEIFRGEIPEGMVLDHVVCNDCRCVNPYHVEPRTQKQNLERIDISRNLGAYAEKDNLISGQNLGDWLAQKDRQRNALGQFVGG